MNTSKRTNAQVSIHLDWLRYTVPNPGQLTRNDVIARAVPARAEFAFAEDMRVGSQGYNQGARLKVGQVFWHDERPAQGIGVQLTGADLAALRAADVPEPELLAFVQRAGGHVTTMHAAIDVIDARATTQSAIDAWQDGTATGRARQVGVYASQTRIGKEWITGKTLYLGAASSELRIRIYDKAAEQNVDRDWLRIEMVWKGRYATAAHAAMLVHGIERVTRTALAGQASFPLAWWELATSGETCPAISIPHKPTNTYKWLRYAVLPVLVSELDAANKTGDDMLWIAFYMALNEHRPPGLSD